MPRLIGLIDKEYIKNQEITLNYYTKKGNKGNYLERYKNIYFAQR
jgi:hypothetical protein